MPRVGFLVLNHARIPNQQKDLASGKFGPFFLCFLAFKRGSLELAVLSGVRTGGKKPMFSEAPVRRELV